jgi:putative RecB family exonuclease
MDGEAAGGGIRAPGTDGTTGHGPGLRHAVGHGLDPAPGGSASGEAALGAAGGAAVGHLSPSSAATFTACPRRWRFRYVERLPDPPGLAALAGTLVHRVLERLLAEPPPARTPERARELAAAAWVEHAALADLRRFDLDDGATRAYKWRVWRAVAGLWELEDPGAVAVAATEQRLEVDLSGVPFVGVIDRVERVGGGLVVTDYKSGRLPAAAHRAEKLEQVLWYAAAVAASTGEAPVRARLLYLGVSTIEVETPPGRIADAVGRLGDVWQAVRRGLEGDDFPPRTGPLCAWCPFVDRCPEGRREVMSRFRSGLVAPDAPALRLVA